MTPRLKLVLLIAEGYLYLALVVAIFLSVPALLIWGLVARRPFVAVVAILVGVPVAMTAWRALRALWLAPFDANGIEITPQSSAALHATVQELARLVGAPRVHRLLLGHAHNASAAQTRYGWIPWRRNIEGTPGFRAYSSVAGKNGMLSLQGIKPIIAEAVMLND